MPTLSHVLIVKGTDVATVEVSATVLEAVETMRRRRVGSVLVVDSGLLAGLFSERDAAHRVLARNLPPATTFVSEVMSRDIMTADPAMSVRAALHMMTERRWRHLPVGTQGVVVGVVSIGDLAKCAAQELDRHVADLSAYIGGPFATADSGWPVAFLTESPYADTRADEEENSRFGETT